MQEQEQQQPIEMPVKVAIFQMRDRNTNVLLPQNMTFVDWAALAAGASRIMADLPDSEPTWADKDVTFAMHPDFSVTREDDTPVTAAEWASMIWLTDALMRRSFYQLDYAATQEQQRLQQLTKKIMAGHG